MATEKPRFSITLDETLLDKVEDYRHENRISTRSKAVVQLVELGINELLKDTADTKKAPPLSDEAMKIADAFDKADPKSKDVVRLALAEYLPSAGKKTGGKAG